MNCTQCNRLACVCRGFELIGDSMIEKPEPLIAHGAGPAAPRKIRRNVYHKELT